MLLLGNELKLKFLVLFMILKESMVINIFVIEKDVIFMYDMDIGIEWVVFEEDNGGLEVVDLIIFVIDGIFF